MRVRASWLVAVGVVAATVAAGARPAHADVGDVVLSRLANRVDDGQGNVAFVPDQLAFRALASQLGVVLAPQLLTPADTIGFGGFQFSFDYTTTSIDSGASYLRALDTSTPPGSMRTLGVFVRKGMWLPLPSFETGVGAVHLYDSSTWAAQLYAKLGVHEGYHDLPLPSVAVRGAVSRVMNQRELDLTVASLDVTVSKHVGVGGTWRFDPYGGWNYLWVVARSEVLDPTPDVDPLAPGDGMDKKLDFVFRDQADITRTRLFAGAKLQYEQVVLTIEGQVTFAGHSVDDRPGTSAICTAMPTTTNCDTPDTARAQAGLSIAAGFQF